MKIALLANPDNLHVQRWAEFLNSRGHELMLIADPHTSASLAGVEMHKPRWNLASNILAFRLTPKPHGNSLWKFLHYRPLIRRFNPDVVHGFEAYYSGLATAWAGPYPKVLSPWGKDVHHDAFQGPMWKWIVRKGLEGVDRITTNDESLPDWLEANFGIAREKVKPFSWGIDLETFHPKLKAEAEKWRNKLEIAQEAPVIFSPRQFHPYWGARQIVESIQHVIATHDEAVFILLGWSAQDPQNFKSEMLRVVREHGLEKSVRWIDEKLNSKEMAELFNLAELFISVPEDDLLASTILEGMACGCMPVLADLPAYRKHTGQPVNGGENALVVKNSDPKSLAEAIQRGLSDPEMQKKAGEFNAKRMKQTENARINMAQIENVYQSAIQNYRNRHP